MGCWVFGQGHGLLGLWTRPWAMSRGLSEWVGLMTDPKPNQKGAMGCKWPKGHNPWPMSKILREKRREREREKERVPAKRKAECGGVLFRRLIVWELTPTKNERSRQGEEHGEPRRGSQGTSCQRSRVPKVVSCQRMQVTKRYKIPKVTNIKRYEDQEVPMTEGVHVPNGVFETSYVRSLWISLGLFKSRQGHGLSKPGYESQGPRPDQELRMVLVKPRSREGSVSERLCNVWLDDARDELVIVYETVKKLCIGSQYSK
uniref:Uncharacterized protein n=1 Tax=Brassica oleracea var. oleracea TaxID=109376 RepID=A0A0D3D241_BRAOL